MMMIDSADDANDRQIEIDHYNFRHESCLMYCYVSTAIATTIYFYFTLSFLNEIVTQRC